MEKEQLDSWRKVWREGIVPSLSQTHLQALAQALERDDKRLLQKATTSPPPLQCVQDWPTEASCPLAFCGWQGDGLKTVGEVAEFFATLCFQIDTRLGEPAACRYILNWWDDNPRDEVRTLLLQEVREALQQKVNP